jgi:hypothetical protein
LQPHTNTRHNYTSTLHTGQCSPFTQLTTHQPPATRWLLHYTSTSTIHAQLHYTSTLHQQAAATEHSHQPNNSLRKTQPNSHRTQPPFSISASAFSPQHYARGSHQVTAQCSLLTAHQVTAHCAPAPVAILYTSPSNIYILTFHSINKKEYKVI